MQYFGVVSASLPKSVSISLASYFSPGTFVVEFLTSREATSPGLKGGANENESGVRRIREGSRESPGPRKY